jgi:hypothetical protein
MTNFPVHFRTANDFAANLQPNSTPSTNQAQRSVTLDNINMGSYTGSISTAALLPAYHVGDFREATSPSPTTAVVHTDTGIFDHVQSMNPPFTLDKPLMLGHRYLSFAALNFGYDVGT